MFKNLKSSKFRSQISYRFIKIHIAKGSFFSCHKNYRFLLQDLVKRMINGKMKRISCELKSNAESSLFHKVKQ